MELRKLGADGPDLSAIGLGCMRMTPMAGKRDEKGFDEGIATIQSALDAGITFLNTGDFYAMGANELLVGQALRGRRDQAFVSVKFGAMRSPTGQFLGFDARPNSVKNFCAYSLQRLGLDVIDLYQPSRIDPAVPIEDTIGAVADLIKEGKVRYLGVSEFGRVQGARRSACSSPGHRARDRVFARKPLHRTGDTSDRPRSWYRDRCVQRSHSRTTDRHLP